MSATHTYALLPVLDRCVLDELREAAGDEMIDEVIHVFLEDAPMRLTALGAAVGDGIVEAVAREAHGLKGSALGVGASRMAQACEMLEHTARAGSLEDSSPRLQLVTRELEAVSKELHDARGRTA
ncbi:MAG TPA: Hpt domain-containing protein [Vicinamibacterales bacterium]|jgi:HPt (histidine-containing phosphotransfer) domain-containing protein|nr:Hpt domain-containing protein [Vicinamibacterales bacterium]